MPILASGDLDEYRIAELRAAGACIDGYGLGTQLVTGVPVNGVYKLVEIDGIPVMKESTGKVTYPGRKQVFRQYDDRGQVVGDRLGLLSEVADATAPWTEGQAGDRPLLQLVMHQGQRLQPPESLETIAQRTRQSVTQLPAAVRDLQSPVPLTVTPSQALQTLVAATRQSSA